CCAGLLPCRDDETPAPGSENCANDVDDDGDGNIDCNDPDCSGAGACRSQTGGAPSDISVNSGCSLGTGPGTPSSALCVVAPLLLGLGRLREKRRLKALGGTLLVLISLGFFSTAQAADFDVSSGGSNDCVNFPPCNLQIALDTARS